MATVESVRGPIDAAALGVTLMHEHVFAVSTEHIQNYGNGSWWDEEFRITDAITRLRSVAAQGVRTFVDPTVWGLGRYLPRIQRINAEVPELNIVVATGYYDYDGAPTPFFLRAPGGLLDDGGPDPLALEFVRDLTVGIADTGVKAAFLKCAVEHPPGADGRVAPGVERTAKAVAYAHRETGAPITVHTHPAAHTGRWALDLFRSEGVDLTKVVLGHSGDSGDLDHLMELADTGAILGMDRFGVDATRDTPARVETVAALAARGYADRMVLSQDAACFLDWFGPDYDTLRPALLPNWHYEHVLADVVPALRDAGVSAKDVDQMLVTNPERYFTR
ncbi:phosphotriesterase-related protein [Actinocorallia longicatena]